VVRFTQPPYGTFDAAEWAPSTASKADIAPAANNEAADYRIAGFLQSMRWASGQSVHLKFFIEQHVVAAQPTGTKMLNSYFPAPIVL
jgi:hypothetical protein